MGLLFVSYSRKDEEWKDRLLPHLGVLRHQRDCEVWQDRTIRTGDEWRRSIGAAIDRANAAILLLSANFFNSEYINNEELPKLLRANRDRGLKLFPVLVRDCAWRQIDWLSKLQICTFGGRPLAVCDEAQLDMQLALLIAEIDAGLRDEAMVAEPRLVADCPLTNIEPLRTSFVGRQREIQELAELFAEETTRLVTLTGPPGIGKTRLSGQLGHELLDRFPGGCWFANLTEAVTVAGIAHSVAQAFDASLASAQMSPQKAIAELLRPRGKLLLILDNFEQVVEQAQTTVGFWLRELPEVRFLVTSREILNLYVEREFRLDPLSLPPESAQEWVPETLLVVESVKLFTDRARKARPDFRLDSANAPAVVRICRELEGLPLALELAAARVRIASPAQIAEKLGEKLRFFRANQRDRPDRQQTLFSAIDWSYQLLKDWEQQAFVQISIFRGGFFLEAAESVVDLSSFSAAPPVADVVQSLCEKNLLNLHSTDEGERFGMYVAIQDYGEELLKKLPPDSLTSLARRWAHFYIPYAQRWNGKVHSAEGNRALDLLSLELENLFAIQDWFLERGASEIAAEAILAFAETMAVRGPAHLRVPRLEKSLPGLGAQTSMLRGRLMTALAAAHWILGEWNEATELADGAVECLSGIGPSLAAGAALRQQGRSRLDRGFLRRALDSLEQAQRIYERLGDRKALSVIEADMAGAHDRLGDLPRALALVTEAEKIAFEEGDETQRAVVLNRRGLALWHHGQAEEAVAYFTEAERINQNLGALGWVAAHRTNRGLALADLDEFEAAFDCFRSAEQIHRRLGNQAWAAANYGGWSRAYLLRNEPGDLERALELMVEAEERSRRIYYPENIALHSGDRGRALFLLGRAAESRTAVREAVALERIIGASKDPRHFSNLVTLARIDETLGHDEEAREAALYAGQLRERLRLSPQHRVRRIREDLEHLSIFESRFASNAPAHRRLVRLLARDSNIHLTDGQVANVLDSLSRVFDKPSYEYPWHGLERDLSARGETSLRLFGYGSLLNRESASRTLRLEGPGRLIPAVAFGVVRLFNFEMPDPVRARFRVLDDPFERGLLNVRVTGFMTDGANGVLIEVAPDEIEPLRQREVGYDLRPVVCIDWDGLAITPRIAYVLSCPDRLWKGRSLTHPQLKPHRDYFQKCAGGAASISEPFLRFWRETTFLADGETRVSDLPT